MNTTNQEIIEGILKDDRIQTFDYGCEGMNDDCCGTCGGDEIDEYGLKEVLLEALNDKDNKHREEIESLGGCEYCRGCDRCET